MEARSLERSLRRQRPQAASADGPLVSLVVVSRDGEHRLRRLLDGLSRRTRYRAFEIVLVDNGSTDGSVEFVETWGGTTRIVRNTERESFSKANNRGIVAARGELVLLVNNDIEPVHPDWLGYMVESLLAGAAAVGAMLVDPKRQKSTSRPSFGGSTVQHLGIAFENSPWGVQAVNSGAGLRPRSISPPSVYEVPAVSAACLLARRADLLDNPLDESYWYGSEDWDLCLRLRAIAPIMLDQRAVLLHHASGSPDPQMSEASLAGRTHNHVWFNSLWGPALRRQLRTELTDSGSAYFFRHGAQPTVLILPSPGAEQLEARVRAAALTDGWSVTNDVRTGADLAIAFGVPERIRDFAGHDLSVAVVLGHEEDWARSGALDGARRVIVPDRLGAERVAVNWGEGIAEVDDSLAADNSEVFAELLRRVAPQPRAMRVGIATCAPTWERAQYWGDTHLARGLMRAFRRRGHEATELIEPDWRSARAASCDVVIHLRGLTRRPVARGQRNLLWIISHPDRVEPDEYDDYDIIACASHEHARDLTDRLGRLVHVMPQATDADTFKIGLRDPTYETDVLYVGNARRPSRRAPRWMMRKGRSFHLYGKHWDDFPEVAFLRADYISNRDLATAYRSASIVVADHHGSMRSQGFVANRLFDVLASGGVVLSDDVGGLDTIVGDTIPTYSNADELESQIRVLLSDAPLRRRLAAAGRETVMAHHTLDHRAAQWLKLLDETCSSSRSGVPSPRRVIQPGATGRLDSERGPSHLAHRASPAHSRARPAIEYRGDSLPHHLGDTTDRVVATKLDVLVIAELRFPGGTSTSLVEELIAARDAGYRVGVLHLVSPRLGPSASVHPGLRHILDEGIADLVLPGEPVRAPLTIVKHPMVFAVPLGAALPVETDTVIVTVGQVPADAAEVYYDPQAVDAHVVEALGSRPTWAPVSAAVRATLRGVDVADDDWTEIIDVDRWRRPVEKREQDVARSADVGTDVDDRLVIGRHSRPHPLKWPGDVEVLRAVYPTDGSVRVRVLGGADAVSDILGEEPDAWEVFPFGSVAPRDFLAGLDAFVYYHHSDLTEAFGRTILEALAVGVPVVVPHHFRATFGDACIYADAECALTQLRILLDDPTALRAHLERSDDIVRTRFGHGAHGARVRRLIGPPSARVGDAPTTAVPSLALVPPGMRSSYATTLIACLGASSAELEDAIRALDFQRRQAPGFIPIVVVEGMSPPLAAELGIETVVITSRIEWNDALEPWSVYAERRLRQLAGQYQADNIVPTDLAGADGSIVLQMRAVGASTHVTPRRDARDQRRIHGLEAQIARLRSRRALRLADMVGRVLRSARRRLDAMRSGR